MLSYCPVCDCSQRCKNFIYCDVCGHKPSHDVALDRARHEFNEQTGAGLDYADAVLFLEKIRKEGVKL